MKLIALAIFLLATSAQAAEQSKPAPAPSVVDLQTQIVNLQAVVQLLRQQRDEAQKQAADNAVEAYMAQHPVPPKETSK